MHINDSERLQKVVDLDLKVIRENWNLTPAMTFLAIPEDLRPHPCPSDWQPKLIQALRRLSELTVGQRDRAHALLETYFRARIRCGLYKVQQKRIYACLEVVDVEDAIRSRERMVKGQALEDASRSNSVASSSLGTPVISPRAKRKFSIRDEPPRGVEHRLSKIRRWSEDTMIDNYPSPVLSQSGDADDSDSTYGTDLVRSLVKMPTLTTEQHGHQEGHTNRSTARQRSTQSISKPSALPRASVPWLQVPSPRSFRPGLTTSSDFLPRTPISALLNKTPSPVCSSARLPPVSALIREMEALEQWPLHRQESRKSFASGFTNTSHRQSSESEILKLELEQEEAFLEFARQKHVVAAKKAAVARLELGEHDKWDLPARPRSSHGRIG